MQTKVATRLRAGGSAFFGERELGEDLLRQRQFPEEVVQEQGKRLARARRLITEENKKKAADTEKEMETENISGKAKQKAKKRSWS